MLFASPTIGLKTGSEEADANPMNFSSCVGGKALYFVFSKREHKMSGCSGGKVVSASLWVQFDDWPLSVRLVDAVRAMYRSHG